MSLYARNALCSVCVCVGVPMKKIQCMFCLEFSLFLGRIEETHPNRKCEQCTFDSN